MSCRRNNVEGRTLEEVLAVWPRERVIEEPFTSQTVELVRKGKKVVSEVKCLCVN